MTQSTEQERAEFEAWLNPEYSKELDGTGSYIDDTVYSMFAAWQAGRRAPVVPETIEQRAEKLKGLQVLIGATAGVPEAIELARSRFVEAYGHSPLHDDLAYACLLIEAFGAPVVPHGWKLVPEDPTPAMIDAHALGSVRVLPAYVGAKEKAYERLVERYKAMLAAAPQPPDAPQTADGLMRENPATRTEAAPVQLPEPEATVYSKLGTTCMFPSSVMRKGDKIYTEHQVRQLLADQAAKEKP